MEHYSIRIKYREEENYLIWFSEENDDFIIRDKDKLKTFRKRNELYEYSTEKGIFLNNNEECKKYDFDILVEWLKNGNEIELNELLDYWNLFIDISVSMHIDYSGDRDEEVRNNLYKKLCDRVIWTRAKKTVQESRIGLTNFELQKLVEFLKEGIEIYRKSI